MKKIYTAIYIVLAAIVLLWFLPWIYSIAFPSESSDRFVVYSPVADCFIVSEIGENGTIAAISADGDTIAADLTKSDRDSLVPQMYFNQLIARDALPDTVAGRAVDIPSLKHGQWVFTSSPRDLLRVEPRVYPIMESRPKRVDLEDPTEVFTLDGCVEFIDMATNTIDRDRSARFGKVFADRGFAFPERSANANITARKAYDEGYLLVDALGRVFHLKMQAGQPYLAAIALPEGVEATRAFILENPDTRHIGLVTTADGSLYAIEREGYKAVRLPVDGVYPERQRITIMKNMFNWVVKLSDDSASRWTAFDSETYRPLGTYASVRPVPRNERIARWIFPVRLSFTSTGDCLAYPRLTDFSAKALALWAAFALIVFCIVKLKNIKK